MGTSWVEKTGRKISLQDKHEKNGIDTNQDGGIYFGIPKKRRKRGGTKFFSTVGVDVWGEQAIVAGERGMEKNFHVWS